MPRAQPARDAEIMGKKVEWKIRNTVSKELRNVKGNLFCPPHQRARILKSECYVEVHTLAQVHCSTTEFNMFWGYWNAEPNLTQICAFL